MMDQEPEQSLRRKAKERQQQGQREVRVGIVIPDYAKPNIQNVVGTMNLGCQLQLTDIYWKAKNAEYNPNRFAAVIMRLQKPKTTALIFRSGKMVITGAKSQSDCKLAGRKYAKIINKIIGREETLNINANSNNSLAIENVVASSDVKFPIHLDELQFQYQTFEQDHLTEEELLPKERNKSPFQIKHKKEDKVQYEPEVFPGLVYRMKNPKVTFLIFVSGKIVVTGAKSQKIINESFLQIYQIVQRFKKGKFIRSGVRNHEDQTEKKKGEEKQRVAERMNPELPAQKRKSKKIKIMKLKESKMKPLKAAEEQIEEKQKKQEEEEDNVNEEIMPGSKFKQEEEEQYENMEEKMAIEKKQEEEDDDDE